MSCSVWGPALADFEVCILGCWNPSMMTAIVAVIVICSHSSHYRHYFYYRYKIVSIVILVNIVIAIIVMTVTGVDWLRSLRRRAAISVLMLQPWWAGRG